MSEKTRAVDKQGQHTLTDTERAHAAIEQVEHTEQDALAADLAMEHPHGVDVGDGSGHFRKLMEQIDVAETEEERIAHYQKALHMVTHNWLGEQGLKVGEVALMLGGMMAGLGSLATKAIKSIFVIGVVMYLDHQLPEKYRMGRRDKTKITGLSAMSTAIVGRLPQVAAEGVEDGLKWIFSPLEHMIEGIEYGIEGVVSWRPWAEELDIELSDGVMASIHKFIEGISGVLGFSSVGVTEWFFNSTHAVLMIFYNHLENKREQLLHDIQEFQQQASSENQDEIIHLKQDVVLLQQAMKQTLDEQEVA